MEPDMANMRSADIVRKSSELTTRNREVSLAAIDRYIADLRKACAEDQGRPDGRPGTAGHELQRDLEDARQAIVDTEAASWPVDGRSESAVRGEAASLRYTLGKFSGVALLRALWWRHVRRDNGEACLSCGRPVRLSCPSWWWGPDALWAEVVAPDYPGTGIRCIPCFTEEARAKGVCVIWAPSVDSRLINGRWVDADA